MPSTKQWWTRCIMVSLFVSLAMYGCGPDDEDSTSRVDETILRRWTLASIERADGTVVAPDTLYTVTFTQESAATELRDRLQAALRLSLHDGCNDCEGGYTVSMAGALSISIGPCTLRACLVPPALADLFVGALSNASSYEVQGNTLRIVAMDGESGTRRILNFSAQ